MNKYILISLLLSTINLCGYIDYAKQINQNILDHSGVNNTYTVRQCGNTTFVNGPNGYFGTAHENSAGLFYNSYDNNHVSTYGHGFQSGDTYYYNEYCN